MSSAVLSLSVGALCMHGSHGPPFIKQANMAKVARMIKLLASQHNHALRTQLGLDGVRRSEACVDDDIVANCNKLSTSWDPESRSEWNALVTEVIRWYMSPSCDYPLHQRERERERRLNSTKRARALHPERDLDQRPASLLRVTPRRHVPTDRVATPWGTSPRESHTDTAGMALFLMG